MKTRGVVFEIIAIKCCNVMIRVLISNAFQKMLLIQTHQKVLVTESVPNGNTNVAVERPSRGALLRTSILVWLVLQNSIHFLLLRYTRARSVQDMFLSSVAVFFTEILKLFISLIILCFGATGCTKFQDNFHSHKSRYQFNDGCTISLL
jgi:hypothetical protein